MNKTLQVQELAIAIAVKNHNPAILTLDFLKYSGIIPDEWQIAHSPTITDQGAQIIFQEGVSIVAQPDKIVFLEAIANQELLEIKSPGIACKYIQTLAKLEYRAVAINLRGHAAFEQEGESARHYLFETLLAPGPWQEFGTAPAQASLQFSYKLEQGTFNLAVNDALLQQPESEPIPVVLFSGNFNYSLTGETQPEKFHHLQQTVQNWQNTLEIYTNFIQTKFLQTTIQEVLPAPVLA